MKLRTFCIFHSPFLIFHFLPSLVRLAHENPDDERLSRGPTRTDRVTCRAHFQRAYSRDREAVCFSGAVRQSGATSARATAARPSQSASPIASAIAVRSHLREHLLGGRTGILRRFDGDFGRSRDGTLPASSAIRSSGKLAVVHPDALSTDGDDGCRDRASVRSCRSKTAF